MATPIASYDRTANTEGRSVDSTLWPMLCSKSQFLDRVKVGSKVDEPKIEWLSANGNSRIITGVDDAGANTIDTDVGTVLVVSTADAARCPVGTMLKNASKATPIGTYKVDEIILVTAVDTATGHLTVARDYGANNAGTGSAAHVSTNTFEMLFTPRPEGSSATWNKYVKTTLSENFTSILDFHLTVTGTELARSPLIAADNMALQYDDRTTELAMDVASFLMYGAKNSTTDEGSATQTRTTMGLKQAISQAGSLLDYATTAPTQATIDDLFEDLFLAGNPMNAKYAIVSNPKHIRTIVGFGASKVQITQSERSWGRFLNTYISDMGSEAELIADPMCSKSDLFIINMDKIELVPFRPWRKLEWGIDTSTPDGTDAYKQRVLGEYTVKVIDPLKCHAAFGFLSW